MWDPGISHEQRTHLYKIKTHYQIYSLLSSIAEVDAVDETTEEASSRTEFDSHANMPVVGRHAYIISETGKIADVSPFTPDYKSMEIPIVDAAIQYEDPYDGKVYILVIRNALYVPSMRNNLLPPFILRQAGIEVNDVPKIHTNEPSKRTPLRLPSSRLALAFPCRCGVRSRISLQASRQRMTCKPPMKSTC